MNDNLKERYLRLKKEYPKVRIRDAAGRLNVSEVELLATGIGENDVRLNKDFKGLLHELHTLGRVMALTRNDEIVHE
ncbi:MAG: hemin-degrading factor, partial [Acidobacteriota bacterium]|nr:hemin-degrading factor [Acidobacteriota bacterium]